MSPSSQNFFMIIPRNWTPIMLQRTKLQTIEQAEPTATDIRFKLAAFMMVICWCTICVSLWHSIRHYEPRNRGWFNRTIGFLGYMPFRFALELPLLLGMVGYQIICSFRFRLSPLDAEDTNLVAMYLGGYVPSLLIIIIQIVDGFMRPNEDRELIRQRRARGDQINRELGIVKKPAWWRRVNGHVSRAGTDSMADQVLRNVREVNGGRIERLAEQRAARAAAEEKAGGPTGPGRSGSIIEMNEMRRTNSVASSLRRNPNAPPPYTPPLYGGKSDQRRETQLLNVAASMLFPASGSAPARGRTNSSGEPAADGFPGQQHGQQRPGTSERSRSTGSAESGASLQAPPQQVRSMLDV